MKAIVTNVDRTILLVEDEPLIAFTEKMLLERSGYAVITADSGDEALTVFGEQPEIALVLMDIDLGPGRDGPDTAREMLRIGFEEAGMHRIIGRIEARNTPSARVLERLGMRREAHFVQNEFVKGEWTDEVVYAVLREEWLSSSGR